MTHPAPKGETRQAKPPDDLEPLLELCKAGRLFDVQAWVAAGKPVNPPKTAGRRERRAPLDVAIDSGFYSLVEVLLRGGAEFTRRGCSGPMSRALKARRFDLVKLLVEHGYDPAAVDLREVFDTWDADMMEYFIDRGADAETGRPLAYALCQRIRTALRVFKRYRDRFPSFQEQADIALRHHCRDGNLKWVSLMLWAGADPLSRGAYEWEDERDSDGGICALALAALYDHYEVFALKQVRPDPRHPSALEIARYAQRGEGLGVLEKLLAGGLAVNDQPNGGSTVLQSLLTGMDWEASLRSLRGWGESPMIDSEETREKMEAVHLLAEHGAKWLPEEASDVNAVRRSLLKLAPEYTVEFVGIMTHFRATTRENLDSLLRPKSLATHVVKYRDRVAKLLAALPPT